MQVGRIEYSPGYRAPRFRGTPDDTARQHVEGVSEKYIQTSDNDNFTPAEARELVLPTRQAGIHPLTGKDAAQRTVDRFPNIMDKLAVSERTPGFTYLASPYSKCGDKEAAAAIVAKAAAYLMRNGEVVYSPIAHGHPVAAFGLPLDWTFWKAQCQPMIDAAARLVVLQMEGWGESVGVQYEIGEFRRTARPIKFMGLDELVLERMAA